MKILYLILALILISGCVSTSTPPLLAKYSLANDEKRLIKINPVENKTGNPQYDQLMKSLTGKFIDYIERSGKYKVIDSSKKVNQNSSYKPDSIAIASLTRMEFQDNCLFGVFAWINTPTVEADMDLRIIDIDNNEVLSTASVTEKAWEKEWVALYLFRVGERKTPTQLEPIAIDYALKALANKL